MERYFGKSFNFKARRFEEWQAGRCISSGLCNTTIIATSSAKFLFVKPSMKFELYDEKQVNIDKTSTFYLQNSHILRDRIQYANTSSFNPTTPCVCHIFFELGRISCVRFAMTNPDRIVEYYGEVF